MNRTLRRRARCLTVGAFSLDGCELAQSAILNKVDTYWPPFDVLRVVSMSNHDRRGLLIGPYTVNNARASFDFFDQGMNRLSAGEI